MNQPRETASTVKEVFGVCFYAAILLSFTETLFAVVKSKNIPADVAVKVFSFEAGFGLVFFLLIAGAGAALSSILRMPLRRAVVAAIYLGFPVLFGFHWILETYLYSHRTRAFNFLLYCVIAALTSVAWVWLNARPTLDERERGWPSLTYWFVFPMVSMLWFSLYLALSPNFTHFPFFYGWYAAFFLLTAHMVMKRGAPFQESGQKSRSLIPSIVAACAAAGMLALVAYVKEESGGSGRAYVPAAEARENRDGPNIILISLDTLRADHLSCYGYEKKTSPAIDRLAAQGVRFEYAISQAPSTIPSHSSLFTSLLPYRLKGHRIAGHPSMAELLKAAGYRAVGFTGGHFLSRTRYGSGFDIFDDQSEQLYEVRQSHCLLTSLLHIRRFGRRYGISARFLNGFNHWCFRGPNLVDARAPFGVQRRNASEWLEAHGHEGKFFLFLHTYSIHDYFLNRKEARENADLFNPGYEGVLEGVNLRYEAEYPRKQMDIAQIVAWYDGEILDADKELERLLDDLVRLKLRDSTLVVLLSDHGEGFDPERNRVWHGHRLTDDVLRVPLIMVYPGVIPAGRVISSQVALLDVMPTVLDLLKVDCPKDIDGRSLTPLIVSGDASSDSRHICSEVAGWMPTDVGASVRTEDQKLIKYHDHMEFYDLQRDPLETNNLAGTDSAGLPTLLPLVEEAFTRTNKKTDYGQDTIDLLKALGYL